MSKRLLTLEVKNNHPGVLMRERCIYYLIKRASELLKIDLHLPHETAVSKMERSVLEDVLFEKIKDPVGRQQLGDLIAECQSHHRITEAMFSHEGCTYEFN